MTGPLVLLSVISLVGAAIVLVAIGPRRIDADVAAALVIGVLLGGTIDRFLPLLVRGVNRAMRTRPRDDAR